MRASWAAIGLAITGAISAAGAGMAAGTGMDAAIGACTITGASAALSPLRPLPGSRLSLILKSPSSNSNSETAFFFMRSMMTLMSFKSMEKNIIVSAQARTEPP